MGVFDFNATPDAASICYLTGLKSIGSRSVHYHHAWAVAEEGPGCAWNIENPNGRSKVEAIIRQLRHRRRVDYVLLLDPRYAPLNAKCYINSAKLAFDRPLEGIWASDH